MSHLPEKLPQGQTPIVRQLPSGRTVSLLATEGREEIEIRSAGGDMEVRIALTPQGPVLQLRGARLQIDSTDAVAVNCRSFEVNAADGVKINSAGDISVTGSGEMRLKTAGQTFIDGDYVNLNCLERTGCHDDPANNPPALPEAETPTPGEKETGQCDCGGH